MCEWFDDRRHRSRETESEPYDVTPVSRTHINANRIQCSWFRVFLSEPMYCCYTIRSPISVLISTTNLSLSLSHVTIKCAKITRQQRRHGCRIVTFVVVRIHISGLCVPCAVYMHPNEIHVQTKYIAHNVVLVHCIVNASCVHFTCLWHIVPEIRKIAHRISRISWHFCVYRKGCGQFSLLSKSSTTTVDRCNSVGISRILISSARDPDIVSFRKKMK